MNILKTMENRVRLLDLQEVSYLRSQTIYHAVAKALNDLTPDTVVLMSPREPYTCIGYHQDLDQEVDLDYCQAHQLPVLRREVGGGTVYLDSRQLFYACIFHRRRAPRRVDEIYRLFLRGPIETYRQLGVKARLSDINDIVVEDRKIGGTAAGNIDEAVVVCGNIIFEFDHATMARLLCVPSEAFRKQVEQMMRRHVTSLQAELGRDVPRDEVHDALVAQFEEAMGVDVRPGELTAEELSLAEELDALFVTDEWLRAIVRPTSPVRQVKVKAGVVVYETRSTSNGSYAQLTISLLDGLIRQVNISGDLDLNESQRQRLQRLLLGRRLSSREVGGIVSSRAPDIDGHSLAMLQSCMSSIEQAAKKS